MAVATYDWIAYHAAGHGDSVAAVDLATGRSLTYRDFDRRIGRLAAGLRAVCGVGDGGRVAVLAHNSIDFFEMQFACGRLGAIFVPINWRLTLPELRHIVQDAAPTVLIHDPEFAEVAEALARACAVPHLIRHGPADSDPHYRLPRPGLRHPAASEARQSEVRRPLARTPRHTSPLGPGSSASGGKFGDSP